MKLQIKARLSNFFVWFINLQLKLVKYRTRIFLIKWLELKNQMININDFNSWATQIAMEELNE